MRVKIFVLIFLILTISSYSFSQNTNERYNTAQKYIDDEKYSDAVKILNDIIILEPGNHVYHKDLGLVYNKLDEPDKAINSYLQAIKLNQSCIDCYEALAKIYYDKRDADKAEQFIEEGLRLNRENAFLYYLRGLLMVQKNQNDRALMDLTRAVLLDRTKPDYLISRANIYIRNSEFSSAYSDISDAIKVNPDNSQFYYYRAFVLMNLNILDEALKDVDMAIQLNDKVADYYNLKFSIHSLRREFIAAEQSVLKSIDLNPDDFQAFMNLGDMYFQTGQYSGFCNCYQNSISKIPESLSQQKEQLQSRYVKYCNANQPAYYYVRSLAEFNNMNYDEAINIINKGLKVKSNSPVFYNIKGSALLVQNKYDEAKKEFEKCIELQEYFEDEIVSFYTIPVSRSEAEAISESYTVKSYYGIAISELCSSLYDSSLNHINSAVKLAENMEVFPGIEYLYLTKGMIYAGKNEWGDAKNHYGLALNKNPENITIIANDIITRLLDLGNNNKIRFTYEEKLNSPRILLSDIYVDNNKISELDEISTLCDEIINKNPDNAYLYLIRAKIAQLQGDENSCDYAKKSEVYGNIHIFSELNMVCD